MEPIKIDTNKKRLFYQSLFIFMLYVLLIGVVGNMGSINVGIIGGLFALPVMIFHRRWNTPALTANYDGITDATGTVPGGLVYWNEIADIETVETHGERLLLLRLFDTDAYLARLPDATRKLLSGSAAVYGTPCVVAQGDLAVPVGEARDILLAARARFVPQAVPLAAMGEQGATPVATTEAATPAIPAHWWTAIPPEERAAPPTQTVGRRTDR